MIRSGSEDKLWAAILCSMEQAGLREQQERASSNLALFVGLIPPSGFVDLGLLYRRLTGELGLSPEQASATLGRVAIYVNKSLQLKMSLPQEAGAALEEVVGNLTDADAEALVKAVDAKVAQGKPQQAPAPAPAPAKAAPAAKAAPVSAAAAPAAAPEAKKGKGASPVVKVAAVLGLCASLGAVVTILRSPNSDASGISEGPVATTLLAPAITAQAAKIEDGMLVITVGDEAFASLPQAEQAAKGGEIYSIIKQAKLGVGAVKVLTPTKEIDMIQDPTGSVFTSAHKRSPAG